MHRYAKLPEGVRMVLGQTLNYNYNNYFNILKKEQIRQKAVFTLEIKEQLRQSLAKSTLALSGKEDMRIIDFEYSSLVDNTSANIEMASLQVTTNNMLG